MPDSIEQNAGLSNTIDTDRSETNTDNSLSNSAVKAVNLVTTFMLKVAWSYKKRDGDDYQIRFLQGSDGRLGLVKEKANQLVNKLDGKYILEGRELVHEGGIVSTEDIDPPLYWDGRGLTTSPESSQKSEDIFLFYLMRLIQNLYSHMESLDISTVADKIISYDVQDDNNRNIRAAEFNMSDLESALELERVICGHFYTSLRVHEKVGKGYNGFTFSERIILATSVVTNVTQVVTRSLYGDIQLIKNEANFPSETIE